MNSKKTTNKQEQRQEDQFLERIYTDAVKFRKEFDRLVINNPDFSSKIRLIIIHGVGGVGKTTALRMSRLLCGRHNITAVMVDAKNIESTEESPLIDILEKWAKALSNEEIKLNNFESTLKRYRQLKNSILSQARQEPEAQIAAVDGELFKPIPIFGLVAKPMSELLLEWIREKYSEEEVELYSNSLENLTQKFLEDLETTTSSGQSIVLMLDSYEKIDNLNRWICNLTKQLPQRVMMVIATRKVPQWNRYSPNCFSWTRILTIEEMKSEDIRQFINKVYKEYTDNQQAEPQQVEQIIEFARGIPMFAETVVRLWLQHGAREWKVTQSDVVLDLVKYLLEDVSETQRKAFQSAAIFRYFCVDSLKFLLPDQDAEKLYEDLIQWPFVRSSFEKRRIHDSIRPLILEYIQERSPSDFRRLHKQAKKYYEYLLQETLLDEQERYQIKFEILYHTIGVNEQRGIKLFQDIAEELATSDLREGLRNLLIDANSYDLKKPNSVLWKRFYDGRLEEIDQELEESKKIYQYVAEKSEPRTKLRAYALFDLGRIYRRRTGHYNDQKALNLLQESLDTLPEPDGRVIFAYAELYKRAISLGQIDEGITQLEKLLSNHEKQGSMRGIVATIGLFKHAYGIKGDWINAYLKINRGHRLLQSIDPGKEPLFNIVKHSFEESSWIYIWSGRYHKAELITDEEIGFFKGIKDIYRPLLFQKDFALVLGLQGKYQEASLVFSQVIEKHTKLKEKNQNKLEIASCLGFLGLVLMRQGNLNGAEIKLEESLKIKEELQDCLGIPEVRNWLGELYETKAKQLESEEKSMALNTAKFHYNESLNLRNFCRRYFECGALLGLARVSYLQEEYSATLSYLAEAEQLAEEYEYNDYMGLIKLIYGHLVWLSNTDLELLGENSDPNKFNLALGYYQQSLIYALRYNRFLLDEILSGQSSREIPLLKPIILSCQESGKEGRQMLIDLRFWWQEKTNTIKTSESDTISLIPIGISLQKAERIARDEEQGNGLLQKTIIEQLEEAISD